MAVAETRGLCLGMIYNIQGESVHRPPIGRDETIYATVKKLYATVCRDEGVSDLNGQFQQLVGLKESTGNKPTPPYETRAWKCPHA